MNLSALLSIAIFICSVSSEVQGQDDYVPFDKSVLDVTSFFEQFDYDSLDQSQWKVSHAYKDEHTRYEGQWELQVPSVLPGYPSDKALILKTPASHHAISYVFDQPFSNIDKDLVLQYEVKAQKGLNCAGAYIKLLDYGSIDSEAEDSFNFQTPYQIMFGPDKCGHNNKVHFIIRKQNPLNNEIEEKHLTSPPLARSGKLSVLYTLILKRNQDFEIRINGETAKAGNLVDDENLLHPPLNPPKEAIDIYDRQPEDWDDNEFIPDPEITEKPADYDEIYNSHSIYDPKAVKPDDWDETETEYIDDPNAEKPEEWDDEEDGEWKAPLVLNPKCPDGRCGKWRPPRIPNPNYVGPWVRPVIPNPDYQGVWTPRTIPNPNYYEDLTPSILREIGGLGFELWSMDSDLGFDNIYLGHSIIEAELIGNTTFLPKEKNERKALEAVKPKAKHEPIPPPDNFDNVVFDEDASSFSAKLSFLQAIAAETLLNARDFYFEFFNDPLQTVVNFPVKFVAHCVGFVFIFTFSFGIISALAFVLSGSFASPNHNTKPIAKENDEIETKEVIDGKASGSKVPTEEQSTRRRNVK